MFQIGQETKWQRKKNEVISILSWLTTLVLFQSVEELKKKEYWSKTWPLICLYR